MSQLSMGFFGAIAISLMCGAVQFASGRDLSGVPQNPPGTEVSINRSAKTDRVAGATAAAVETRTVSLQLQGLSDTSVLVRIPVAREARNPPSAPLVIKPGIRKMAVACEPVVSVLTEIARQLQPGRCVT
jgi:hypothetical protein